MKRNLSSQAIRAMAIGMAVTMGATTALSGVVGNVAVVKAEETRVSGVAANITNPEITASTGFTDLTTSSYILTDEGLLFKVKEEGTKTGTEGQNLNGGGKVTLVGTVTSPVETATVTNGQNIPFKGVIESGKLTVASSNYADSSAGLKLQFALEEIGDGVNQLLLAKITSSEGPDFNGEDNNTLVPSQIGSSETSKIVELAADIRTIANSSFNGVTVEGNLDLSTSTNLTTIVPSVFNGSTISGIKLPSNYVGEANSFNGANITTLDLSALTTGANLETSAFSGATIGSVTLASGFTGSSSKTPFNGANITTLDLNPVTTGATLETSVFSGATIGSVTLASGFTGSSSKTPFNGANITTLDLSPVTTGATLETSVFSGATIGSVTVAAEFTGHSTNAPFTGATIETLDLSNISGSSLENGALTGITSLKNVKHNGKIPMGSITLGGTVDFADNQITGAVLSGTTLSQGSKIIVNNASQVVTTNSADAFKFNAGTNTTIEFKAYTEETDKANIVAAFGTSQDVGTVKILIPENKSNLNEASELERAIKEANTSATNVKVYANNVVAGIDNPASIELTQDKYILTADGKLFKVVRAKGTGDIPVAEAAFVGTVAEAGASGEANGTTIPYVATLTEDTLSIAPSSGEAVTCKVNQIGDGATALSKYTINGSISASEGVLTEYTLNVPTGKSVEIANKAFENITNVTITSTEGITAIGNEAFKGATISTGTLNTTNVISFGESAFEGATLTPAQEIVVNETAMATLTGAISAFKFTSAEAGTKIKLVSYDKSNETAVVGAFQGATGLTNVTVEIPYSLDAETLKKDLQAALNLSSSETGVTVTVAAKGNQGTVAPKQGDIISTTSGDVFEVLTPQADETAGTVKLVSLGNGVQSRAAVTTFDGSFANGVVTVTYNSNQTATFNVTELGDGSKAITTGTVAVDTLTPYLTNATTLAAKALEGATVVAGPKVSITIPETLTTLGATSLQLTSDQSAIVIKVPGYGTNDEQQITQDELVKAIGTTQAKITIELPAGADSAALKAVLTSAPRVEVRTELPADAIGTTVKATKKGVGTYTFKIIEQENTADVEKTTKNKVALVEFTPVEAPSTREAEANFSGAGVQINGVDYALSQLGDGENPIKGVTDAALDAITTTNVTTVAANAFKDNKDVTKIDLPKAETIGSSAFESTSVQSINAPKATTVGANAFANNEKLVSVNVGTEATGQIKIDSSALSGSSNITVVNTNKDSKDQVTEAIKQSGTQNNVTVSAGGTTETVKPEEETKKPSNGGVSGGGANIGSSNGSSNTTTETVTETTTETTTEGTTQTPDKTLSLDVISLPSVEGEAVSFSDVSDSSWAKSYIDKLSTAGIISGSNGKFNPNGQTKRADVTVMLVKLLGLTPETNNKFTDVDPNAYYAPYVGAASSYGIVNGSNGMFKPESVISRQDTMVMIAQILRGLNLNVNTDTSTLNQFSDVNNISSYAQESVAVLVNSGIISGSNGKLNPTKPVTRAEMATIMSKLYDLIDSAN